MVLLLAYGYDASEGYQRHVEKASASMPMTGNIKYCRRRWGRRIGTVLFLRSPVRSCSRSWRQPMRLMVVMRALWTQQISHVSPVPIMDVIDGEVHELHLRTPVVSGIGIWRPSCVVRLWVVAPWHVVGKDISTVAGVWMRICEWSLWRLRWECLTDRYRL